MTSVEVVDGLKSKGLTYVGTMRNNKGEEPLEFMASNQWKLNYAVFGFTCKRIILCFLPKKNGNGIMLSFMHHSGKVNAVFRKSEIIDFSNSTKIGVDTLNQNCASYSVYRCRRRWLLNISYAMLDISLLFYLLTAKLANKKIDLQDTFIRKE